MKDYTTDRENSMSEEFDGNVVTLTVYGEPVSKLRPRTVRNGKSVRTYTPHKTAEHEAKIGWVYKKIYGGFRFERDVPLFVSVKFYMKVPKSTSKKARQGMLSGKIRPAKKPDLDNVVKLVTDSLNGIAYDDDSQIVEISGGKYYSDDPRTEIIIARVEDDE